MKASSVPSKTLLSTKQRGSCGNLPLLAFLFLCEYDIATEPLWREFFEAAGDWRSLASVYVHIGSQEEEQAREVAVVRGSHERRVAKAALQVDTRTSFQQHRDDLKVAVACGGVQEGEGCGLTVTC